MGVFNAGRVRKEPVKGRLASARQGRWCREMWLSARKIKGV